MEALAFIINLAHAFVYIPVILVNEQESVCRHQDQNPITRKKIKTLNSLIKEQISDKAYEIAFLLRAHACLHFFCVGVETIALFCAPP